MVKIEEKKMSINKSNKNILLEASLIEDIISTQHPTVGTVNISVLVG